MVLDTLHLDFSGPVLVSREVDICSYPVISLGPPLFFKNRLHSTLVRPPISFTPLYISAILSTLPLTPVCTPNLHLKYGLRLPYTPTRLLLCYLKGNTSNSFSFCPSPQAPGNSSPFLPPFSALHQCAPRSSPPLQVSVSRNFLNSGKLVPCTDSARSPHKSRH